MNLLISIFVSVDIIRLTDNPVGLFNYIVKK